MMNEILFIPTIMLIVYLLIMLVNVQELDNPFELRGFTILASVLFPIGIALLLTHIWSKFDYKGIEYFFGWGDRLNLRGKK